MADCQDLLLSLWFVATVHGYCNKKRKKEKKTHKAVAAVHHRCGRDKNMQMVLFKVNTTDLFLLMYNPDFQREFLASFVC